MTKDLSPIGPHPSGEQSPVELGALAGPVVVDSFAGSVRVEWDHAAAFTPFGQLPFFIDFLKTAGLFEAFVADCPLNYTSPNAAKTRDVLGTAMLSMLAGHKRYSHIAALRGDGVLPELLDMRKIVSEDAVRRAFSAIEEEAGAAWTEGDGAVARYRLLDTTRAYATEKLEASGEREPFARRHAEYYRDVFEGAELEWNRPSAEWLADYAWRIDDVRAALDWAFSPGGNASIGVALTAAAAPLWMDLSLLDECRGRVERALAAQSAGGFDDPRREMKLLSGTSRLSPRPSPGARFLSSRFSPSVRGGARPISRLLSQDRASAYF